jgi:glycosyltransferase involved in cell wall biosynthesis
MTASSGNGNRKRLLLITYPFPPVGGAGVQRVTKFVKYLPRHGWDVSVLTVSNPSVPLFDNSLAQDIPPGTLIRRARSWEPGYAMKATVAGDGVAGTRGGRTRRVKQLLAHSARRLGTLVLQPDPQILWLPGAVAEGRRLLRQVPHNAILASGPPFSTFLVAAALARSSRIPLVLDYRDEWTISNEYWENKRLDPLSRSIQSSMQRRVIRASRGLIATTRASAESLQVLNRQAGDRARVTWIYNGFDPDDFGSQSAGPGVENDRFRLSYVGTLWNLTSAAPLVEAVRQLAADSPELAQRLELVFAGRRTGLQAQLVSEFRSLPCTLVEHDYLEHSVAVDLMRGSGALCLLLSDLPGAGRVVPAKLFEYMATGRPILTIAPPGEARELLYGYPGGQYSPRDIAGIACWLADAIRGNPSTSVGGTVAWDARPYTRDTQAGQLAAFLNDLFLADSPLPASALSARQVWSHHDDHSMRKSNER